MELKTGQYIQHFKYGLGTIVSRDEEHTQVDFDTAGMKTFITSIAVFEAAEGQSPRRKRNSARKTKSRSS